MQIFLSYDDDHRNVAERLALALRAAGHKVFFDQDTLPPGTTYDDRIRHAILRADLLVFLISREAIRKGAYAMTELAIAQRKWPHPTGRVLPVLVDDTSIAELPTYLRAVSVLQPQGDLVGDAVNAVEDLATVRRRRHLRRAIPLLVLAAVAGILWFTDVPSRLRVNAGTGDAIGAPTDSGDVRLAADSPATTVAADSPTDPPVPVDEVPNSHVYQLRNQRHVRMIGAIVENRSNVAENIIREAIEWNAWRYNRCYDAAFGHLAGDLPEGTVTVRFEIDDQLPRGARVATSDFTDPDFNECIAGTVLAQTINAAGPDGGGPVQYSFRFLPS